jgi:hypothetical protein
MSTPMPAPSIGDETRIMPPVDGPPPPLDPAIARQAAHAIDHGPPKEALPPDLAAAVDRLLDEGYRMRKYADDLSDLDPAIVAQAAYAIDYETPRNSLPPDAQAAYDRLQAIGYPRNRPSAPAAVPVATGALPGADAGQYQRFQEDEAARYQRFQAAEAARAGWDQAMQGNGSDSGFVRWLTRKPLPVKMTGYRILCGLCWAFWTIVFTVGTFVAPGFGHVACFLLAALCGLYDWRIWTRRATRLSWLIIF